MDKSNDLVDDAIKQVRQERYQELKLERDNLLAEKRVFAAAINAQYDYQDHWCSECAKSSTPCPEVLRLSRVSTVANIRAHCVLYPATPEEYQRALDLDGNPTCRTLKPQP